MYSRDIQGKQDRRRLAELFRRIGCELRRLDDVVRVISTAPAGQPDGQAVAVCKPTAAKLTAPDVCPALPSRTEAGAVFYFL